jgi:hypothetical protein
MPAPPKKTTPKVFIDSSVLFAAAYSARGSARDLLIAPMQGHLSLVISSLALEETERSLAQSAPNLVLTFLPGDATENKFGSVPGPGMDLRALFVGVTEPPTASIKSTQMTQTTSPGTEV